MEVSERKGPSLVCPSSITNIHQHMTDLGKEVFTGLIYFLFLSHSFTLFPFVPVAKSELIPDDSNVGYLFWLVLEPFVILLRGKMV